VILNIGDEAALAAAWHKMRADLAKLRPDVPLDGILVEAMARPGAELIVGARNDPAWGPVLVVGLGGVLAEALCDSRILAADTEPAVIVAELGKLRCAALLSGFRGAPPLDLAAVADVASRLGRFAAAHPEIAEIDMNPLVVYAEGEGAIALDALIVSRGAQDATID
jgi:acetate---CoA ligase (ADP-forming)